MPKIKFHKTVDGIEHKHCTKCARWLALQGFHKDKSLLDGLHSYCKTCASVYKNKNKGQTKKKKREYYLKNKDKIAINARKYRQENKERIRELQRDWREKNREANREKRRQYYLENKERITELSQKYRKENREKINEKALQYYRDNKEKVTIKIREYRQENKEKVRVREKAWREKNKDKLKERRIAYEKKNRKKINQRERERRNNNPSARVSLNLRNRLLQSLRRVKLKKQNNTFEYISCTPTLLLERLERQRHERGLTKYHVDHMKPLHSFDLSDPEQMRRAWHWSNLQALSPKDNLQKGGKIVYDMRWCERRDQWLIRSMQGTGPYRPTALFQSLLLV